jgi:hypothetical protein
LSFFLFPGNLEYTLNIADLVYIVPFLFIIFLAKENKFNV